MTCPCLKRAAEACKDLLEPYPDISSDTINGIEQCIAAILALSCTCSEQRYAELLAHAEAMVRILKTIPYGTVKIAMTVHPIAMTIHTYEQWRDRK